MMQNHTSKYLKEISINNKKHVGSLKYEGLGVGEVYKKILVFFLADFGIDH